MGKKKLKAVCQFGQFKFIKRSNGNLASRCRRPVIGRAHDFYLCEYHYNLIEDLQWYEKNKDLFGGAADG